MALPNPSKAPNLPDPGDAGSPFLKPEHLSKKGYTRAVLVGNVREGNSRFGDGINVDVKIGRETYILTVKFSSGNYPRLFKQFGKNPAKWNGPITLTVKQYSGKDYVAVV